ncbi:MAG: hypothetical protein OXD31_08375 [Chloroflexi bacterium]|nr:hypothetical protein [Chloroflexota bacterium]
MSRKHLHPRFFPAVCAVAAVLLLAFAACGGNGHSRRKSHIDRRTHGCFNTHRPAPAGDDLPRDRQGSAGSLV